MKLNHINLPVNDVSTAVSFFEQYFGFTCTEIKGDHIIAVLKGADDFYPGTNESKRNSGISPGFSYWLFAKNKSSGRSYF